MEGNADTDYNLSKPNLCRKLCLKLKMLLIGFKQREAKKFFLFLILQGICMPYFPEFDYFWALDVIKIS